mmetsp:Transcript_70949/g.148423  ORF Transcript_70949/g.148423 Transcript_70949/m.148423 type:complete len:230 (-) Transcript_70949:278-967(-)
MDFPECDLLDIELGSSDVDSSDSDGETWIVGPVGKVGTKRNAHERNFPPTGGGPEEDEVRPPYGYRTREAPGGWCGCQAKLKLAPPTPFYAPIAPKNSSNSLAHAQDSVSLTVSTTSPAEAQPRTTTATAPLDAVAPAKIHCPAAVTIANEVFSLAGYNRKDALGGGDETEDVSFLAHPQGKKGPYEDDILGADWRTSSPVSEAMLASDSGPGTPRDERLPSLDDCQSS